MKPHLSILTILLGVQASLAQDSPSTGTVRDGSTAPLTTTANARTMTFGIPAPRGMIMDRNGIPLAQNKVWYQMGILFGQQKEESPRALLHWAKTRINAAINLTGKKEWELAKKQESELLNHYKNRRWLPYLLPGLFNDSQQKKFSNSDLLQKNQGLVLHPQYLRYYPQKSSAAHIIGYVRSVDGNMPTGTITDGEDLFLQTHGMEGIEKTMNSSLEGIKGNRYLRVNSLGETLVDETDPPKAGRTIALTIDIRWQQAAESILRSSASRGGAFSVVDCHTGEILVLASNPTYDINQWVPRISTSTYEKLRDNKYKPMFARAFQAQYPPASGFKPIVAATALTEGTVSEHTLINCPAFIKIGSKTFRNHSKIPAGKINVTRALAKSNNVWFYQVGIKLGSAPFLSMAQRMGFGTTTTTELYNEKAGFVPSNEWAIETIGRKLTQGQTANYSIGQGEFSATPLQIAQGMAALANGEVLPRLHIIKQVQDIKGRIIRAARPEARNRLGFTKKALEVTHKGMMQVVHSSYGTGKYAAPSYTKIAGKTGTAEWYGNRRLAWFSGFIPYENPRYAFACVYEGSPGQRPSGGKYAAPMVRRFLNNSTVKSGIEKGIKATTKATVIEAPEDQEEKQDTDVLQALPLEDEL